ncbi:uncharacterized protein LOC135105484 [Scylla paramamosain]|uniref:uncharacterized protein LOC135105484 n=1 Tax=Scylla paramamosain TaxID=85552 RepID=UPI0030839264
MKVWGTCWLGLLLLLLPLVASSEDQQGTDDASSGQLNPNVAQDRMAAALPDDDDGDVFEGKVADQIAVETVDRHVAVGKPYPVQAIPVPVRFPVYPGKLVLPDHAGGRQRAKAKDGTGPVHHQGPPKRHTVRSRLPPPPPPSPSGVIYKARQPVGPGLKVPGPRKPLHPPPPPAYSGPPPPPTYSGPPPPPPPRKPVHSGPTPLPHHGPPQPVGPDYGSPKPGDVFSAGASTGKGAGGGHGGGSHVPQPILSTFAPAPLQSAASVHLPGAVLPPPPQNFYNGPPPPPINVGIGHSPDADVSGSANAYVPPEALAPADPWPTAAPEMPKITSLDVKCEKNLMKVSITFDKPFYGIIFSKGHYSNVHCVHLPAGLGRSQATFDISINACGTTGNTENGLYGYGSQSGSGTYFENTIVVQYDPQVQEVWDQARKLRCTWHDQYEKSVTFRPFPVDMLDVVRADFAGDNVGCWMQIQVGKGPWASEVSGLVKIGQTMTMVLAIKDDDNKFDMLVRNCMAHDGKRAPIQLVDQRGCVSRPKLMSKFTKIKNFGSSASVLSYAHFQAFKFPDSMEVHFQCTIQICRYQCPEQCSGAGGVIPGDSYDVPGRAKREVENENGEEKEEKTEEEEEEEVDKQKDIGVNRVIQVVSIRDLPFVQDKKEGSETELRESETSTLVVPQVEDQSGLICMSTPGFAATLIVLLAILIVSCLMSAFLCLRFRSNGDTRSIISSTYDNPAFMHKKGLF